MGVHEFLSLLGDAITGIVTVVAAASAIGAVISALYIWYVYANRQDEAPFLTRLVHRDIRVSVCSAVILFAIVASLLGVTLQKPWAALIVGIPVVVMMYGPIGDAVLWWRERRSR